MGFWAKLIILLFKDGILDIKVKEEANTDDMEWYNEPHNNYKETISSNYETDSKPESTETDSLETRSLETCSLETHSPETCSLETHSLETRSLSIKHEQKTEEIECSVCGGKYDNMTEYRYHLNMHLLAAPQPKEEIDNCPEQSTKCTSLTSPENLASKSSLTSPNLASESSFTSPNSGGEKYECVGCGRKCLNKSGLEIHRKYTCSNVRLIKYEGHCTRILPFNCGLCNQTFSSKYLWTKHIDAVHSKLKLVPGSLCEKRRESIPEYMNNLDPKLNPYFCTLCGNYFKTRQGLTKHVSATHQKSKSFSCPLCPKSFSQKGILNRHVETVHKKVKPFSCSMCDKSFGHKWHLITHTKTQHPT